MFLTHAGCAFKDPRGLFGISNTRPRCGSLPQQGRGKMKSETCCAESVVAFVHVLLLPLPGPDQPQFRTAALRSNRQCGAAAFRTRVPLRRVPAQNRGERLLVQLDQTSQMLVTIVCDTLTLISTTPLVKMHLEQPCGCVAMKAPVGLSSRRAVCVSRWKGFALTSVRAATNAKNKNQIPLNMPRVQQRRPLPAAEAGRSCWGRGQQDTNAAQGMKWMLGAATLGGHSKSFNQR